LHNGRDRSRDPIVRKPSLVFYQHIRNLALQATATTFLLGLSTSLNVIHLTPATSTSLQSSPPTHLALLQNSSVLPLNFRPEASPLFLRLSRPSCIFCRRPPVLLPVLRLLYTGPLPSLALLKDSPRPSHLCPASFAPSGPSVTALCICKSALVLAAHENVTWKCTCTRIHTWSKGFLGFCQLSSCRDS
jgi:hypothetical protein